MARIQTIITTTTCDLCGVEAVESYVVAINAGTRVQAMPRTMDLCDEHAQPYRAVRETFRHGTPIGTDSVTHDPDACPVCGQPARYLIQHLRRTHKTGTIAQPAKCPDCGFKTSTNHSMAKHRGAAHDYDLVAAYVQAATPKDKAR